MKNLAEETGNFYPNLIGEMAKVGINKRQLAVMINRTQGTTSLKLAGKSKFTIDECFLIKRIIGSEMPLDDLFSNEIVR